MTRSSVRPRAEAPSIPSMRCRPSRDQRVRVPAPVRSEHRRAGGAAGLRHGAARHGLHRHRRPTCAGGRARRRTAAGRLRRRASTVLAPDPDPVDHGPAATDRQRQAGHDRLRRRRQLRGPRPAAEGEPDRSAVGDHPDVVGRRLRHGQPRDGARHQRHPGGEDVHVPGAARGHRRAEGRRGRRRDMANNHGMDYGARRPLRHAARSRPRRGFPILGIGADENEAYAPFITEVKGQRIGVIAANDVFDAEPRDRPGRRARASPGIASAEEAHQHRLVQEVPRRPGRRSTRWSSTSTTGPRRRPAPTHVRRSSSTC